MAKKVTYQVDVKTKAAQNNVKNLNKDLDKTGKSAKDAGQKGKGLSGVFDKLGISIKALGIGALVSGLAAVGGVFVSAFKRGNEFAKTVSGLKAVSGATESEIGKLSDSAKKLGAATAFSATQVVELQTEFAKLGFTTDQILNMTGATLDLAASLEVSLADAAMLSGSTLRQFGLEAEDTQRVVDVLSMSTTKSALDFAGLQESLKLAGPVAKATNVSLEKTTALLGTLANGGLKGSIAGTGLAKTFIMLGKKGITLEDALETVNNTMETSATSTNKLNKAVELVGVVGAKSLITLAANSKDIDVLQDSLEGAAGAATQIANTRLDNLAGDTTALESAWEGFLLSIEDGQGIFTSIARSIVQATTALVKFITPTIRVSDALADERIELFKVQAQLEDVNITQEDRISLIDQLQKQYPDYLEKIDKEKVTNEELNKIIEKINGNLVNKILIQKQEEEIQEQAEEAAERLNEKIEARTDLIDREARIRAELSEKNIKVEAKNAEELAEEIDKILEAQNKLRKESGDNVIKDFNRLRKQQQLLKVSIKNVANAEEEFNEEQEKTNKLVAAKNALMKQLGMTTEETTEKTEIDLDAKGKEIDANFSLIKQLEDEIKLKKEEMSEATTEDIKKKNIVIKQLQDQLKALRTLGIEEKKLIKIKKEAVEEELLNIKRIEAKTIDVNKIKVDNTRSAYVTMGGIIKQYYENLEKERQARLARVNEEIQLTAAGLNSIQAVGDAVFAHKMKNLDIESKEGQKVAEKQFKFNKALQLGLAVVDGAKAITSSLSQSPVAIGPVPNPAGIASLAFAITTSAAQIATIAAQKFQPNLSSATSPSASSPSGGVSQSQAPQFNIVGNSPFNQIAGALNQPIQAYVVAQDVTTAQQLDNGIITSATLGGG